MQPFKCVLKLSTKWTTFNKPVAFFWFYWTFHDYFGEPLYTLLWPWRFDFQNFENLTHRAARITQQFETKPPCAISTAFLSELKNGIISATKISITGDVVVIFATYFRRESAGSFLVKVTVQFPGKSTPGRFVHFVCFLVLLHLAVFKWRKGDSVVRTFGRLYINIINIYAISSDYDSDLGRGHSMIRKMSKHNVYCIYNRWVLIVGKGGH